MNQHVYEGETPTFNGATFTGPVTVPTPVNPTDASTKQYIDNQRKARSQFYAYDDFVNVVNSPFFLTTGSGTTGSLADLDASGVGIATLNTGSGTTNNMGIWSSNVNLIDLDTTGLWQFEGRMRFNALSNGTNGFQAFAGFLDVAGGESVDGCYFSYTDTLNSGKFELVTSSNSTRTRTDSGITVAANTWYVLKVIVLSVSGTLTARFYINDTQVGGDISTNVPTGTSRVTGYGTHIKKTLGTTNVYIALDYMEIAGYFSSLR